MSSNSLCSPHPRGWSLVGLGHVIEQPLLPAPAGMVSAVKHRPKHGELLAAPAGMVPR
ncbi:hypothetical protein ACFYPZ_34885 [Streptomyces sp. NPDC005506]|uniref:hypothetical protein n=1 Tax=unclassified Streptomyces TaxID=2593676 RepID=UPI0036AABDBC